ncbi:MAG: phosphodiester glycosidase family protein [Lachnospiraceae bacterium]|nr:phosphodiester glycosidase family protein [Lachnospiraceae bacterium]
MQCVRFDSWEDLEFFKPVPNHEAFLRLCSMYKNLIVPKFPLAFSRMVLMRMPEGLRPPLNTLTYGRVTRRELQAAYALERGLKIRADGKPEFASYKIADFYEKLKADLSADVVCGLIPKTRILPVGNNSGFLSEGASAHSLRVNASFFVMDCFDLASPYDVIGTPLGLNIKNGEILSPPLFGRESLLVRDDRSVSIETPRIHDLKVLINGVLLRHGRNAVFAERPEAKELRLDGFTGIAIVGTRVVAVKEKGTMSVPASGFAILVKPEVLSVRPGDRVAYQGLKSVTFGIQVGNSLVKNGLKTTGFVSTFYNIKNPFETPYPPSLYPLDFNNARAARIALGADKAGNPLLLWAEGASKVKNNPGEDSTGASLKEFADICKRQGMYNGINLDGGGSAQILLHGQRALKISDRHPNNSEMERAVPLGLMIK